MKTDRSSPSRPHSLLGTSFVLLGLGAALFSAIPLAGQSVLTDSAANASQQFDDSVSAAGFSTVASALTSPLRWANIDLSPHFSYRYLYGDGIRSGPGREEKTAVHSVSPGITFALGSRWSADYTATKTFYSSDAFRDRLNHAARANGGANYGNLELGFGYRYADTEAPLAETAEQTRQRTHGASVQAGYSLGQRTGLSSSANFSTRSATASSSAYKQWSFVEGIQYRINPALAAGVNVGFGFTDLDEGSDMSYVRPGANLNWQATDKISMSASVGWEERSFDDSGVSNRGRPTYSGSLAYRPLETTTLVLSGSQGVSVSFFRDQITENRTWSLALQQRLLTRLMLGVTYSWRTVDFETTRSDLVVSRNDESNTLGLRLGTRIFKGGNVSLTFQKSDYDSNSSAFAYDSEQFGAEFGYRF